MSSTLGKQGENGINPVLKQLSHGRRRQVLDVLRGRRGSVPEEELARRLAAAEEGEPVAEASEDAVHSTRVELAHVHLPALDDAGLVERDESEGSVRAGDHALLREPAFERVLELEGEALDAILDCLADGQRRAVLAVLGAHEQSVPRRALAHEVLVRTGEHDPASDAVEPTLQSLHHVHLPKMESAGLVEYDRETGVVSSGDRAGLATAWIEASESESSTGCPPWLASSLG